MRWRQFQTGQQLASCDAVIQAHRDMPRPHTRLDGRFEMQNSFMQQMLAPADAAIFLEMTQVFQAAARVPLPDRPGPGYKLTDIPMNRGLLAATSAMRKRGDAPAVTMPVLSRLMNLGDIFEQAEYFGHFIRAGSGEGCVEVSEALLRAAAVARMLSDDDGVRFDLADVLAHAQRFEAAGEGAATQ